MVLHLLTNRRQDLVAVRTQTINRLHRLLMDLVPGGARRNLTAKRAAVLLATVTPAGQPAVTRHKLAADLVTDVRGLDQRIATVQGPIKTVVAQSNKANPTRSLVGLPTFFWYSGYDGRPLTRTVSAFGVTVQVEATPTSYRWSFGDGASLTSEELGRAYPARSRIAHTYHQAARPAVRVSCQFGFMVRWRTGDGPWAPLPPLARTASTTLEVAESQTVIAQ